MNISFRRSLLSPFIYIIFKKASERFLKNEIWIFKKERFLKILGACQAISDCLAGGPLYLISGVRIKRCSFLFLVLLLRTFVRRRWLPIFRPWGASPHAERRLLPQKNLDKPLEELFFVHIASFLFRILDLSLGVGRGLRPDPPFPRLQRLQTPHEAESQVGATANVDADQFHGTPPSVGFAVERAAMYIPLYHNKKFFVKWGCGKLKI